VLVFAGLDPSGGAGISADIEAIGAQGAHALPVITTLTVQDNNRVHEVRPVEAELIARQAAVLLESFDIRAVKVGIVGSRANAEAIAHAVTEARRRAPHLPLVLDPVLRSGHGDALARGSASDALAPLVPLATVAVPNLPEAEALDLAAVPHVLVTGGHGEGALVVNRWDAGGLEWHWERLPGQFHGSGCTLAAAIAARLALGESMREAFERAQGWCHRALAESYSIAPGQRIPARHPCAT
jgi:hydroxymethylpyrimidine/phosphomethylpyrimidine kinase